MTPFPPPDIFPYSSPPPAYYLDYRPPSLPAYTPDINTPKAEASMGMDDRLAAVESKTAAHDVKIDGLVKEATFIQAIADLRADINQINLNMEKRFGAVETRLTAIETSLPNLPTRYQTGLMIVVALTAGLGAVFAMFKYMIPLPH